MRKTKKHQDLHSPRPRDAKGHFIKEEKETGPRAAVGLKERPIDQSKSNSNAGKAKADRKLTTEKIDAVVNSLVSDMRPENQGQGQNKSAPPGIATQGIKPLTPPSETKQKRRHRKKAVARQTLVEIQTDPNSSPAIRGAGSSMVQSVDSPNPGNSPSLQEEKVQEVEDNAVKAAKELEEALAQIKVEPGVVIPKDGEGSIKDAGGWLKVDKRWPFVHRNGHVKTIMKRAIVFSNKPRGFRQKELPVDQLNKAGIIPVKDEKGWIYPVIEITTEELKTVPKDGVDTQEVVTTKTWSNWPRLEIVKGTSSFDLWKAVRGWWQYQVIHKIERGWWEKATGVASWVIVGLILIIVLMWLYFKLIAK